MRDHELEEQVKAAFDSIELPQTVKQQTLDRVLDRSSADAHVDRSALSSANEKPLSSSLLLRGRSVERP